MNVPALITLALTLVGVQRPTDAQATAAFEIAMVRDSLLAIHPDPGWSCTTPTLQKGFETLLQSAPTGIDVYYLELARALGRVGDMHTSVFPGAQSPALGRTLPIRLRRFGSELVVRAAPAADSALVGASVVSIGGVSADSLMRVAQRLVPAESRWAAEMNGPSILISVDVLKFAGAAQNGDSIVLRTRDDTGVRETRLPTDGPSYRSAFLSGTVLGYRTPAGWRTLPRQQDRTPLALSRLDRNYWFARPGDGSVVYVQINTPRDDGEPLSAFIGRLAAELRARPPKRLVIDLRFNLGGDNRLTRPLVDSIAANAAVNRLGVLYVLIGRETTSAGTILAAELERHTAAIFAGEPTGSRPNLFSEGRAFTLPYSGLRVLIASGRYYSSAPDDDRTMIHPDILVAETAAALRDGRDAALEAVLRHTPSPADSLQSPRWRRPSQGAARQPRDCR